MFRLSMRGLRKYIYSQCDVYAMSGPRAHAHRDYSPRKKKDSGPLPAPVAWLHQGFGSGRLSNEHVPDLSLRFGKRVRTHFGADCQAGCTHNLDVGNADEVQHVFHITHVHLVHG